MCSLDNTSAAYAVVPPPAKGSRTRSPGLERISMISLNSPSGFFVGCGDRWTGYLNSPRSYGISGLLLNTHLVVLGPFLTAHTAYSLACTNRRLMFAGFGLVLDHTRSHLTVQLFASNAFATWPRFFQSFHITIDPPGMTAGAASAIQAS